MLTYILKRLMWSVAVVILVAFVIFLTIRVIPGDPARLIAAGGATPETIAALRAEMGLDKPLLVQFRDYLTGVFHGDLGTSIFRSKGGSAHSGLHNFVTETERTGVEQYEKAKVLDLIVERVPYTLLLTGLAMVFVVVISFSLGILSVLKKNTIWDQMVLLIAIGAQALPNFWVGIVLILLVSVKWKLLPAMGYEGPAYAILPALVLSLSLIPLWLRQIRLGLADILSANFITGLRARGIPNRLILFKHALRSIAIPLVTVFGIHLGYILGGAIIVEFVFDYPGLGLLTIVAMLQRDFPVVQGIVLVFASVFVLINIGVDIVYGFIDPRVSLE
jgi:ABC-type dipeptide/oligopeptide/nickel transport system permease component